MRLLIPGVCGFVGSRLACALAQLHPDWSICGFDNFIRSGSRLNVDCLERQGVQVFEADLRDREFVSQLPVADWVIDCAANPSVVAGIGNGSSSQELMDHNLVGSLHLLEYCKRHSAGLVLLSTSRVYSASRLAELPCCVSDNAFGPDWDSEVVYNWSGVTRRGIDEGFSIEPPLSLYGVSKLASEWVAREYAAAFEFPLWINRCGVMAGAGQFGKADQGIVAYWIHALSVGHPLRYIGFDGRGHQVRDCLHPDDLARLIDLQIASGFDPGKPQTCNVSGGLASSFSLRQLTDWCRMRWDASGTSKSWNVVSDFQPRAFDCPWIVLDSHVAESAWGWQPMRTRESIWQEIANFAETHPEWLLVSQAS